MAEKQKETTEKYLNLPILTPEEEQEIEEREERLAAERKAAAEKAAAAKKAAEAKAGGADMKRTAVYAGRELRASPSSGRVIVADDVMTDTRSAKTEAAAKTDGDVDAAAIASAVLGGSTDSSESGKEEPAKEASDADASLITEILTGEELNEQLSKLDREALETVLSATDIFKTCILPNKTELQERILKTKSDIIVGDHSKIEFGLYGEDIAVCECTQIYGDIVASGDLRIDNFCDIFGTVICNGDAYVGEGVKIHGKMTIGGNLDIADSVTIEKEYQTFGLISIRSPVPVITYLIIYIFALLQINGEKAAEKKLDSMLSGAQATPLVLPPRTTMDLAYFAVQTPMDIGVNCRLHGNIRAQSVKIKRDTTLFGSVSAAESVKIGVRDAIHGDVAAKSIRISRGADVLGDLIGETVWLHEDAHVSGVIKATEGLTFGSGD
ncbi:MAG: hypothetical protein Q4Q20_02300 [Methanocorpusculum sp.]|nr:hypothetical protein [Methanocorpusculum sp.]